MKLVQQDMNDMFVQLLPYKLIILGNLGYPLKAGKEELKNSFFLRFMLEILFLFTGG